MRRPRLRRGLETLEPRFVLAAPVAVNDTFSTAEDTALSVIPFNFQANFNTPPPAPTITTGATWQYLDKIQNSLGLNQSYPVDGAGRHWTSPSFDAATSTIGPWGSGATPLQGGTIDGFPQGTPSVLDGIGDAPGGSNLINTYLFRRAFTLTASQAASQNGSLRMVCDDGCIVYINSAEVARFNMPGGAVATGTFASGTLNNEQYVDIPISLAGADLTAGTNVIAVEVHQGDNTSSDVGFDVQLSLGASGADGFFYGDSPFATNRGELASGAYDAAAGFNGTGGVRVALIPAGFGGGGGNATSGGWSRSFTVGGAGTAQVSLRYRFQTGGGLDNGEFGEAVMTIDGVRYGSGANSSLVHRDGPEGGSAFDSSWQLATFNVPISAGSHTMVLGSYQTAQAFQNPNSESTSAIFDDVSITFGGGVSGVLSNDTDADGNPLTASLVPFSGPQHGTLNFTSSGSFTYTPNENYFGSDSFQYLANDGTLNSNPATVTINVTSVNDLPVVTSKTYDLVEDHTLTIDAVDGLLVGATDADNPPVQLTAVITQQPAHGAVTIATNGSFHYVPVADYNGIDTFRFAANDGAANSADATVSITISAVNDAPTVANDSYTVVENTTLVADRLTSSTTATLLPRGAVWRYLDNGSNQETAWQTAAYDDSTWTRENNPSNLGAEYGYGDGGERTVVGWGPDQNQKYPTTYFRRFFNVADKNALTAVTMNFLRDDAIAVYVNGVEVFRDTTLPAGAAYNFYTGTPINQQDETTYFATQIPVSAFSTGENLIAVELHQSDAGSSDISFDLDLVANVLDGATALLVNDRDAEGQAMTASVLQNPAHGTLTLNPNGTFTYLPVQNYQGDDSFTYVASDGTLTSLPATVSITVTPGPNDVPIANPESYVATEDVPLVVSVVAQGLLANDTDTEPNPLFASVQTQPAHGAVAINPDGTFTYTPAQNYFGSDSFTYRAYDGSDYSVPATVSITVNPTEDAPVATADHYFVEPGVALVVNAANGVLANDSDPDGTAITASRIANPVHGTLAFAADGSFTYTPAAGYHGVDSFTYQASDGDDLSSIVAVTLTVDGRPDATGGSYQVNEDGLLTAGVPGVLQGDTDPENNALTAVVVTLPAHGDLTLAADGSFSYQPELNYSGPDSFTYAANDGDQLSLPAIISITVNAVNDAPVGVADAFDVVQNGMLSVNAATGVLANDTDVDSPALTAVLAEGGAPQNGILVLQANGSFTYEPAIDFVGPDTFTYFVSDGSTQSTPVAVTINVSSASQLIAINEIMYHPSSENDAEEYIELVNMGIGPISVNGWRFTKGVDFTFPNISIAGGGYLVIAANLAAFSAKYPSVTNVIGGWTGTLSNSGEEIELENPLGDRIDRVSYADEGDWALRRPGPLDNGATGWDWVADHDGGGRSLELINQQLSNQRGQNWSSSTVSQGTPGIANSVASQSTAPLIWDVKHSPAVPRATDTVTVVARLADMPDVPITATVRFRDSTATPGAFADAPMFDDGLHGDGEAGDGLYGAILPARPNQTVVEFYVRATNNASLVRTWPGPTDAAGAQGANALYQVDEGAYTGAQPVFRLVMTNLENTQLRNINRQSNAQMNATFINVDGTGTQITYNVGIRIRGAGSRAFSAVPNFRMNIPSDRVWHGVPAVNLNTQYTFSQISGMSLFDLAGMPFEEPIAIQVRVNGENRATEPRQAGSYMRMEVSGPEWAENHFSLDADGNFYRGIAGDLRYLGETPSLYYNGYSKQTNTAANDYSDLIALTKALDATQTPNAVFVETIKQHANVDQWMRFFALNTLLVNEENGLINGNDDDYSMYRGVIDPRFQLVVHDMDTVLGQGDTQGSTTRNILTELRQNARLARLFDQPEFLNLYYYHLINLADTVFAASVIEPLLDNLMGSWVPAATVTAMKNFARDRVAYVRAQVPPFNTPPVALIDGEPPVVTPLTNATLTVSGAGITAYQYSVDGGAYSVDVPVATPIALTNLANGPHSISVIGRNAAGQYQSAAQATISHSWTVNTAYSVLRINEVLANNTSALIHGGSLPDVIELYNAGATTIDLSGKRITDRVDTPDKFVFPADTTLAAGEYLLLFADSLTVAGIHLGFSLDNDGEGVYLFDTVASGGALLDQVQFGSQLADLSISRDSEFQWRLSAPSLGAANAAFITLGDRTQVKINEWLGDGRRLFETDLIELYNPTTAPVALGGMYITDNAGGNPAKNPIAPLTFMPASGFLVFVADENPQDGPNHVDFQLNADRESIVLLDQHLRRIDTVIYASMKTDVSQGRATDGASLYATFSPPTFGQTNSASSSLPDALALLDGLRISEVMYHPSEDADLEFIELQNIGPTTLHLEDVSFTGGVTFTFPAMDLLPGAFTVVALNSAKFTERYPSIPLAGQFTGRLDNGGENITLTLPAPFDGNILSFTYDDASAPSTDGGNRSLVVKNTAGDNDLWDVASGWRASYAAGGSPGRADLLYADQNNDGRVNIVDLVLLRNKIGSADLSGDLNFDGVVNFGDAASLVSMYGIDLTAPAGSAAAPSAVIASARRTAANTTPARDAAVLASTAPTSVNATSPRRRTMSAASPQRRGVTAATDTALSGDHTWSIDAARALRAARTRPTSLPAAQQ